MNVLIAAGMRASIEMTAPPSEKIVNIVGKSDPNLTTPTARQMPGPEKLRSGNAAMIMVESGNHEAAMAHIIISAISAAKPN